MIDLICSAKIKISIRYLLYYFLRLIKCLFAGLQDGWCNFSFGSCISTKRCNLLNVYVLAVILTIILRLTRSRILK